MSQSCLLSCFLCSVKNMTPCFLRFSDSVPHSKLLIYISFSLSSPVKLHSLYNQGGVLSWKTALEYQFLKFLGVLLLHTPLIWPQSLRLTHFREGDTHSQLFLSPEVSPLHFQVDCIGVFLLWVGGSRLCVTTAHATEARLGAASLRPDPAPDLI